MEIIKRNSQQISEKECGIYIHVPFCRKKCIYCDFFSGGVKNTDWGSFVSCVLNELDERQGELKRAPSTLYIGGGTPSLMPARMMKDLISGVNRLLGKTDTWEEFTIEVNPEDVTDENCTLWRESGATRISMGIQSLNDNELQLIGRHHNAATALASIRKLKGYFNNVTVDLIFGLPGQTPDSWKRNVEKVLAERPEHISAYSLMFEEGTVIKVLRDTRRLTFPEEEECLLMWQYLSEKLRVEGYRQYEISNYALPGKESVHNSRYWLGNPYLGLGPSAHSYDGNKIRKANPGDIKGYCKRYGKRELSSPGEQFYTEETLNEEELIEEKIMLSLRMADGLNIEEFGLRFGEKRAESLIRASKRQMEIGTLKEMEGYLRLTKEGVMVSDDVILDICSKI